MKKIFYTCAALAFMGVGKTYAQDIYKVEMFSGSDLDGDARYVGMGGAMSALGANISAMSTNPASTGLYRRSDMSITAGLNAQPSAEELVANGKSYGPGRTRGTFNQAGFVYALDMENSSGVKFMNFGFNYKKSRNLKNYIGLNNVSLPGGLSQSWQLRNLATDSHGNWLDLGYDNDREMTTPLTDLAYDTYLIDAVDADGNSVGDRDVKIANYVASDANKYSYRRSQWGGIHEFDFNLSMNVNERVYLGFTMGVYDVDVKSALSYGEQLVDNTGATGNYSMLQTDHITGSGIDGKFGIIVRPMEEDPLRIGFSITTPTALDLNTSSYLALQTPYASGSHDTSFNDVEISNNYRIRTPWKLNVSAASTFFNRLAVDVEYEFQNYNSAAVRYDENEDTYYDDVIWGNFSTDTAIRNEIKSYMNNVHTIRFGLEGRLTPNFSARLGYNWVSAPFKKEAYLNQFIDGSSYYYATNTDYVNVGPTTRATVGLSWNIDKNFYIDAAYQHQMVETDVYAFHYNKDEYMGSPQLGTTSVVDNLLPARSFDIHRNSFQVTLGVRF